MLKSGFAGESEYVKTNGQPKNQGKETSCGLVHSIATNIGKEFLKLVAIHFPHHHRLHKICNKTNIKVSKCCMPNMAAIISRQNKIALQNRADPRRTTIPCNCRNKANYLWKKNAAKAPLYKATLKSNGMARHYYGCSET